MMKYLKPLTRIQAFCAFTGGVLLGLSTYGWPISQALLLAALGGLLIGSSIKLEIK